MALIIIGFILATLVGISLGLIGAGGSILTFPILVYAFHFTPTEASAYSLFIVGFTSLIGFFVYAKQELVNYKVALIFGFPSIIAVYLVRRFLMPYLPVQIEIGSFSFSKDVFIMTLFSILMLTASISLITGSKQSSDDKEIKYPFNYIINVFIYGLGVGLITGIVGAGGGFLVMPTLILLAHLPIKKAIGTCLLIMASKSLIGFVGDVQTNSFDWVFILVFCICAGIGILLGNLLSKKIGAVKLKSGFGYFELVISIVMIIKEIILKLI